jgi:hypothetical protein
MGGSQTNKGLGAVKLGRHIVLKTFRWRRDQPMLLELMQSSRSARFSGRRDREALCFAGNEAGAGSVGCGMGGR